MPYTVAQWNFRAKEQQQQKTQQIFRHSGPYNRLTPTCVMMAETAGTLKHLPTAGQSIIE
jgi:hypothetical protein